MLHYRPQLWRRRCLNQDNGLNPAPLAPKKEHRFAGRHRPSPFAADYDALRQDKALRFYWACLTKPNKPVSKDTQEVSLLAVRHFLTRLGKPVTPTILSELVQAKKDDPKDMTFEQELTLWRAEAASSTVLTYVATVCGIFRRNFAPLDLHIHVESDHQTQPIAEPILVAIHQECQQRERDAIELMAFGAERVGALGRLPIENVRLVENSTVAILDIPPHLAKTGHRHPSIIPKSLAERLLENAQRLGSKTLLPNYHSVWKKISTLAKAAYQVELTSHYFRKRFETRCEKIPANLVNPNHWVILMGSRPTVGHIPTIYSLLDDREFVEEYEKHILPRLTLGETGNMPSETEQLRKENAELKEQLLKLTKLLSERLAT